MKNTFLKMYFHSETDSDTASDFQKGQYSQSSSFPDELRNCWYQSSPVQNHLSQTPLSYKVVPCLYPASDWLSPYWLKCCVWNASFVILPSMLGRSLGQGPAGCVPTPHPVHCQWRAAFSACRGEEKMVMALCLVQEEVAFCCWDPFEG